MISPERQHKLDQGPDPVPPFEEFLESELEQSVPKRFEQMVARYPDRLAAQGQRHRFTYRQLNATANRIARAILDRRGPGEEPVCILLDNDALAVASMLGILKAGKLYTILDPAVPRDRLAYFALDSTADLIVTSSAHESLARALSPRGQTPLNVDKLDPALSDSDLELAISPDALAYIYYTSGSSGLPKGVYNSHRGLLHRVLRNTNYFQVTAADRLCCVRSLSFSGSIKDVWGSVLKGASVHLFDPREHGFVRMASWLAEQRITIYMSVATSYRQLAAAIGTGQAPPSLRVVHFGGEPVRWSDLDLHEKHFPPTCQLSFGMGITETGNITRLDVDRETRRQGEDVPAGYPLSGMEVLILDGDGQELPPGQTGQIAAKSRYLTQGYWRQPELTRQRFLPDPAGISTPDATCVPDGSSAPDGSTVRIYLTGDMGYVRPDGCLVCLGRADDQVKVAGHRVELPEIEQVLLAHDGIDEAAVIAHPSSTGDLLLVAYFVASGQRVPAASELRRFLAPRLAASIIPARFIHLDQMPLTRSGKVDRRALPLPDQDRPQLESAYVGPRDPVEEMVASIWQEVLELDRVGIHDNFFDLGGHSLLATRLISQLRDAFGVDISFRALFDRPTVAGLVAAIAQQQGEKAQDEELDQMLSDLEGLPDDEIARMLLEEDEQG